MKVRGAVLRDTGHGQSRYGIMFTRNEQEDLIVWYGYLPHRLAYAWRRGGCSAFEGRAKCDSLSPLSETTSWYNKGYDEMKGQL